MSRLRLELGLLLLFLVDGCEAVSAAYCTGNSDASEYRSLLMQTLGPMRLEYLLVVSIGSYL